MLIRIKNHNILILFFIISISLLGCQLQEPLKTHGILYLENRSNKLTLNKSNKNDVIRVMGQPHIKDENTDNSWIYLERIIAKGKYHKLGDHVLKENNVLVLNFDKYGVLSKKNFYNKEKLNKIEFSEDITENELSQKSFVQKFLQSIQQKMYRNRK